MCLYLVIYHFSALDTVQIHWLMKQTRGGMWGLALFCLLSGEVGAGGSYFLLPPLQRTGGRWDLLPHASSPEEWGQVGLTSSYLPSRGLGAGGTFFLLPPLQRTGGRWDLLPHASSPEEWGQVGVTSSCLPSSCLSSRGVGAGRTYILLPPLWKFVLLALSL